MICGLTDLYECITESFIMRLTLTCFDLESSLYHIYWNDQSLGLHVNRKITYLLE